MCQSAIVSISVVSSPFVRIVTFDRTARCHPTPAIHEVRQFELLYISEIVHSLSIELSPEWLAMRKKGFGSTISGDDRVSKNRNRIHPSLSDWTYSQDSGSRRAQSNIE